MDTLALPFVPQRSKTPDVITVYHGCGLSKVADIVAHIVLEIPPKPKATDFSAKSEQRSFYTTKSEKFARGWAESKAIKEVPAVIKFELKVGDLNVYDFGEETQGGNFERWQKFVWANYMDEPPNHRSFSGFDILMGFMSNADELGWETNPGFDKIQPYKFQQHKFIKGELATQVAARKDKFIEKGRWKVMEVTKLHVQDGTSKWIPVKKSEWTKPSE